MLEVLLSRHRETSRLAYRLLDRRPFACCLCSHQPISAPLRPPLTHSSAASPTALGTLERRQCPVTRGRRQLSGVDETVLPTKWFDEVQRAGYGGQRRRIDRRAAVLGSPWRSCRRGRPNPLVPEDLDVAQLHCMSIGETS